MEKVLITPEQAADALGISRSKVYELIAGGQLASVRIGASRRIAVNAIRQFVDSLSQAAAGHAG